FVEALQGGKLQVSGDLNAALASGTDPLLSFITCLDVCVNRFDSDPRVPCEDLPLARLCKLNRCAGVAQSREFLIGKLEHGGEPGQPAADLRAIRFPFRLVVELVVHRCPSVLKGRSDLNFGLKTRELRPLSLFGSSGPQ